MDSFDERKNNAVKGLSFCKVLMDKLLNSAKGRIQALCSDR